MTTFNRYLGTNAGTVHLHSATYKGDGGENIASLWASRRLDFTDQIPEVSGKWKTLNSVELTYVDVGDISITVSVSVDGGENWTDSSATTIGTNAAPGTIKTKLFYFTITGRYFNYKITFTAAADIFQWLELESDITIDGEYFDVNPNTIVGDGVSPADKEVARSSTNNAVSAFTLATNMGTDTVTALTVTFTGTDVGDVAASGVKIYTDGGTTANEWDATDTLIDTASFSGSTASFTGLTISVDTSPTQYLITYNIASDATDTNILKGAITAATATNTLVHNDTTDATLTVAV